MPIHGRMGILSIFFPLENLQSQKIVKGYLHFFLIAVAGSFSFILRPISPRKTAFSKSYEENDQICQFSVKWLFFQHFFQQKMAICKKTSSEKIDVRGLFGFGKARGTFPDHFYSMGSKIQKVHFFSNLKSNSVETYTYVCVFVVVYIK